MISSYSSDRRENAGTPCPKPGAGQRPCIAKQGVTVVAHIPSPSPGYPLREDRRPGRDLKAPIVPGPSEEVEKKRNADTGGQHSQQEAIQGSALLLPDDIPKFRLPFPGARVPGKMLVPGWSRHVVSRLLSRKKRLMYR